MEFKKRSLKELADMVCGGLGVALAVQRKNDIAHLFQSAVTARRTRERERDQSKDAY